MMKWKTLADRKSDSNNTNKKNKNKNNVVGIWRPISGSKKHRIAKYAQI